MNAEELLLSALISGPRKSTDLQMARSTRRRWGARLEDQGFLRRFRDGGDFIYELTREGLKYAITEHGIMPMPTDYFYDLKVPNLPTEFATLGHLAPMRRPARRWVSVGKAALVVVIAGAAGYLAGRYA